MAECQAESTHTVSIQNAVGTVTYEWVVTSNAFIVSGQGTATVVVGTIDEAFVTFTVTCTVTADNGNSVYSSTFTHERIGIDPANTDTFYIMDVPLVSGAIPDFAVSDPVADGTLHESGGGTWTPTAGEYAEDGIITLAGGSGRYIEVPHEFPQDEAWQFVRCYDVDGRNFKIMVIIYDGAGRASFLYGDQDNYPTLTDGNTNLVYTPIAGNYQITESLDVPAEEITYEMDAFSLGIEHTYEMDDFEVIEPPAFRPVWVSMDGDPAPTIEYPPGITAINDVFYPNTSVVPLVDIDGVASAVTVQWINTGEGANLAGGNTGDNSGVFSDYQMSQSTFVGTSNGTAIMQIYLPAGTYTVEVMASRESNADDRVGEYTLGALGTQTLSAASVASGANTSESIEWVAVSSGQTFDLTVVKQAGSNYAYLNGINITQTA